MFRPGPPARNRRAGVRVCGGGQEVRPVESAPGTQLGDEIPPPPPAHPRVGLPSGSPRQQAQGKKVPCHPPSTSVSLRQPPSASVSPRQPPSGPCQAPVSPYLPQRRKAIDVALGFPMLGYRCSGAGHRRLGDGRPGAEARVPRSSKISILKDRYLRTTLHGASACP